MPGGSTRNENARRWYSKIRSNTKRILCATFDALLLGVLMLIHVNLLLLIRHPTALRSNHACPPWRPGRSRRRRSGQSEVRQSVACHPCLSDSSEIPAPLLFLVYPKMPGGEPENARMCTRKCPAVSVASICFIFLTLERVICMHIEVLEITFHRVYCHVQHNSFT